MIPFKIPSLTSFSMMSLRLLTCSRLASSNAKPSSSSHSSSLALCHSQLSSIISSSSSCSAPNSAALNGCELGGVHSSVGSTAYWVRSRGGLTVMAPFAIACLIFLAIFGSGVFCFGVGFSGDADTVGCLPFSLSLLLLWA